MDHPAADALGNRGQTTVFRHSTPPGVGDQYASFSYPPSPAIFEARVGQLGSMADGIETGERAKGSGLTYGYSVLGEIEGLAMNGIQPPPLKPHLQERRHLGRRGPETGEPDHDTTGSRRAGSPRRGDGSHP